MLLAVTVPKRGVSETLATKHCCWNAYIPVVLTFVVVIATERLLEHLLPSQNRGSDDHWLMAWAFRRRIKVIPGVYINLS